MGRRWNQARAIIDRVRKTKLKKLLTLLILISILVLTSCGSDKEPGVVVDFPDEKLEELIRDYTNKDEGDIYSSDLEKRTSLQPSGFDTSTKIENLTGLEYCTNLIKLDLNNQDIRDLSPLSSLTGLTELILYANEIRDISPLANLTELKHLNLNKNRVRDLTPLASLVNLKYLFVEGKIKDLTPLTSLINLENITLSNIAA